MTSAELLHVLLAAADDDHCVFDQAELDRWPNGALGEFQRLGLLRPSSGRLMAPCPNCADGHIEPVEPRPTPDGVTRFFIHCPEALRVEVDPDSCRGWEIDPDGLAALAARALALTGTPKIVTPGRLWRLGRIPWQGKTREVLLARRMGENDAASVAAHTGTGGRAIVLVPHHLPDERLWPGRTPAVVALSRVATLDGESVVIDGVALAEIVVEADRAAEARSILPIDPEIKRQIVRLQAEVVLDERLERDMLIAAFKEHGSTRAAAQALTEKLGRAISKDKVYRAVRAAGGVRAVMADSDSASIARTVASHPRDRAKKFQERR